jgi:hypothetical protein
MKALSAFTSAIALAATIMVGSMAPAAGQESLASRGDTPSHRYHQSYRPYANYNDYRYYQGHRAYRYSTPGYGYYSGFGFPSAAFLGLFLGGVLRSAGADVHVQWCFNHYRSYRAYDNTYSPRRGIRRACASPY